MKSEGILKEDPITDGLAAISAGIHNQVPILDLCYLEDSAAEVDANFVMTSSGRLIEVQGTAEGELPREELLEMIDLE